MPLPHIDDSAIRRHVDVGSFHRGVEYERAGMVLNGRWDAAAGVLHTAVRGSRKVPYACAIALDTSGDSARVLSSNCTCPMTRACKHVVASLVHARAVGEKPDAERLRRESAPAPWRRILAPAEDPGTQQSYALGFELRVHEPSANPWAPRRAVPAEPRMLAHSRSVDAVRLGIRPMTISPATGKWVRGDVSWDGVRRPSRTMPSAIRQWFGDLLALSRESLLSGTAGEWLLVDHVESDMFFPQLLRARALGVALIAARTHTDVRLADDGAVRVRVERGDDGLVLRTVASIDDEETERVGGVGRGGIYTWALRGARIELVLAPATVGEPVRALLGEGGSVDVPGRDEPAFFADAYPALARSGAAVAGPGVELPRLSPPGAVLSVTVHDATRIGFAVAWEYAGHGRVPVAPTGAAFRDAIAESEALRPIERTWQAASDLPFATAGTLHGTETAPFMTEVLPALEDAGVRVVVTGERPVFRELRGDPEISVSTVETTDPDWFDLGFVVTIDGHRIPFEPLFTALSQRRTRLQLVDGSWFSLAHPALDRLRELIDEAATMAEWETDPRISRHQVALWEDFEDLADQAEPALSWRAAVDGLRETREVPATTAPAGLRAEFRPYQQAGFEWLAFLWRHRLGGILADDMGLGKTLQLLALVQHAREAGEERPFLVVAPTSVLGTWRAEAARFAPGLRVRVVETSRGRGVSDAAAAADLVIASYAVARLAERAFAEQDWAGLILDEAQFVKNPAAQQHRAVAGIPASVTFAVTGTPLENSLVDLWALFQLTSPGLFPSARRFRQDYVQPIEKGKVPENAEGSDFRARRIARLRRRIRPLMLRRTKELVAAELPPKQEQVLHVDLSLAHRTLYDTVLQRERQKVLGLLADLDRNRFIVFRSLTMLRMLALAPGLIDPEDAGLGSRKLDVLVERVTELRDEGHRAIVFSQFTSYLDLAEERLREAGIRHSRLDGSTRRRETVVDDFRSGDQTVFLISLKAGGFGLTLTEADYVFLLDPWWNPAAEEQAIDRTHRIGQREQVFVYRLIAAGTIEEKVLALQQRKARLFTAVMDDDELFVKTLDADDIRALFEH